MPSPASDEIRAAIARADGALRFDRFVDLALYGAGGFYSSGGGAGRRGDFITSPEVGPLFGAVIARWLDDTWRRLGSPDQFDLIEAGAGPGTLARSILAAAPQCSAAVRYTAVEVSDSQRERHPAGVASVASMPTEPIIGVVIANELLDNLPFRLFVMDGQWREAHVIEQRDGSFAEVLRDAPDVDELRLPLARSHGARVPVQQQAGEWARSALAGIEAGRLLVIDYASATSAGMAMRPWRDWLRTYRDHERGEHYLREPGSQDITTEVALDQLFVAVGEPDAVRSQSQFLQRWGIDALVEEGRTAWAEQAARPTVAAMTMRSRIREAEALCDPTGLGAFTVVEFAAN
ncbi:MAG: SAM-dependent methyltransferase [Ilumatobacteraceae bacterium]